MHWVNGELASTVSLNDRSFQYGDGAFTTILTQDGGLVHWPLHIERMHSCLNRLAIDSPDWQLVEEYLLRAIKPDALAGIKLHISRGEGGRGYDASGVSRPTVTVSAFDYPTYYQQWQKDGVSLGLCRQQLGLMPLLAGHKHNNRLEQILCRAEMTSAGYPDGVVSDIRDCVIETTMANLFWCQREVLYTPSLKTSGVAGVMRRIVLEQATELGLRVEVGDYSLAHLNQADEVFITNSLVQIAPVVFIHDIDFQVGKMTKKLQGLLNQ